MSMKTILHCDANNFYCSVEMQLNPKLRGIPIAVTGNPEKRHGIILAKSEEAKKLKVATGDTLWQARQKCPDILFVKPHYDAYVDFSERLFDLYSEYTDRVEPFGIDECWLDCTGSLLLFKSGENIANTLRERAKKEIGVTISVGVAPTKIFAKLGSDYKKPDATTVITPNNYKDIVWPLPVSDLLMVGRQTTKLFKKLNILTIGDLANFDVKVLKSYIGINANKLHSYANGIEIDDINHYEDRHIPESIGHSTTTPFDITSLEEAIAVIVSLSEMVAIRLRRFNLMANGVGLSIKYNTLDGTHKNNLIALPTDNASTIADNTIKLLHELHNFDINNPIRQLGVYTYNLLNSNIRQCSFFDNEEIKNNKVENSVDKIRLKYGYQSVQKGIVFKHNDLCDGLEEKRFKPFKKDKY